MCGATDRKEKSFLRIEKFIMYTWYSHQNWSSSPMKFENQDLYDLSLETLFWINLGPAKN